MTTVNTNWAWMTSATTTVTYHMVFGGWTTNNTPCDIAAEIERERKANKRATDLLRRHLTKEQRVTYDRDKKFHVIAADGQRYEVDCGKRMHNVFALDKQGRRVEEFCIYQEGPTPLADNHLAQKLLLEADPAEFRRIANRKRLRAA